MPEFLPFRITTSPKGDSATIDGSFQIPVDIVPDLAQARKDTLAAVEAEVLSQGLPEDLAVKLAAVLALQADLDAALEECKRSIGDLSDQRDDLWRGRVPSIQALETLDRQIEAARQRLISINGNRDHAHARLDDLRGEIGRHVSKSAREAIKAAVAYSPAEKRAIDLLTAMFQASKAEALAAACLRQRLAYDFSEAGGYLGWVDAAAGKVAAALLNSAAAPADDSADNHIEVEVTEAVEVVTA